MLKIFSTQIRFLIDFTTLFVYCGLIYYLSDQSSLPLEQAWFPHQDKVIHMGAYFVMGCFALRCCQHITSDDFTRICLAIGYCSLFGASDEWHQSFVDGRSSDVLDWLADTSGALFAGMGLYWWKKLKGSSTCRP